MLVQERILGHGDAVVTHCGHNTACRARAYGRVAARVDASSVEAGGSVGAADPVDDALLSVVAP